MEIEYLDWDSNFFKKKIGKILEVNNDEVLLQNTLSKARKDGYELIYVFGSENLILNERTLSHYNGSLVDQKVLYEKSIVDSTELQTFALEYNSSTATEDIITLGYLSGKYSRYFIDKNFNPNDFYRLYKIWVEKSVSHEIANHVFCVYDNETAIGLVTLNSQAQKGTIGLIAVSEGIQGKGIGRALINACINKLVEQKVNTIEVPTQLSNQQACSFYEKCGFSVKSITTIYHFWLI